MGKGGGTIGYHYLCSLLFGIGRGPVNEMLKIKVGGQMAWEGNRDDDTLTPINKPDLFGGKEKEGGIQGVFRTFMGFRDQLLAGAGTLVLGIGGANPIATLPDLKESLSPGDPDDVPEFRGRHMFWYDGLVSSMNPYIKDWEFRRWRTTAGWTDDDPWYPNKATIYLSGEGGQIIYAMNPAHIIYQVSTDTTLGRGMDRDELDEDSFILAANALCEEGFGLCFHWMREEEVGKFVQSVCDHVGAAVYTDRETGLLNLKLIRNDYDPDTLPHFTMESGLLSISEDDSGSSDEMTDEVIVTGKSPITNQTIQGRSHNLAVRNFRGGATTKSLDYPGLPTLGLCNRVAERDRDMSAAGLRKFTVMLDRSGFRIHPGAVFRVSYPPRGLVGIVLRAGEIDDGNLINGQIKIACVQDVFALPLVSFVTPVENTWEPPSKDPLPADAEMIEASYRDLYLRLSPADMGTIDETSAQFGVLAASPSVASTSYDILDRADGESVWTGSTGNFFTAGAILDGAITSTATSVVVKSPLGFPAIVGELVNRALYIGGEYMRIESYNAGTKTFTVERGCVDTWPRSHVDETRVWLIDDDVGNDDRTFVAGETVEAEVLPRTSTGALDEDDADILSVDLGGRPFKPYPPADVQVGGESIFGGDPGEVAEPELTWVARNRLTQADFLVGFHEAAVTAEASTTYKIEIYDETETLVNTYDPITSPWTYEAADQTTDGFVDSDVILAKIYSVRDGVDSLEQSFFRLRRAGSGYGLDYGMGYGGS